MSWDQIGGLFNYWIVIFLMMTGFYIVLARENLIKSVIGLNIFQTSVFLLYITMGKIHGGTAPIIPPHISSAASHGASAASHGASAASHGAAAASHGDHGSHTETASQAVENHAEDIGHVVGQATETIVYSNPLPSVLMLTAIVVGIATTALALALVVRIREDYGSIDEEQILKLDRGE